MLIESRLEEEKAAWEALAATSKSMPPPPTLPRSAPPAILSEIDTSLLDPEQAAILSALQIPQQQPTPPDTQETGQRPPSSHFTFTTPSALQSHLTKLSQSLEPSIDLFADGVHKIEQYRNTAERVADRVLGTASKRLDERDRDVKARVGAEGIGVGDVLRGLAGVLSDQ
jgi:kinetochore protein Mis13/DSN1